MTDLERRALLGDEQAQEECAPTGDFAAVLEMRRRSRGKRAAHGQESLFMQWRVKNTIAAHMEPVAYQFRRQSSFGTPARPRRLDAV